MTKNEYDIVLKELNEGLEKSKRSLAREYALSNNPYNVGDIFTDHLGQIKIEAIGVHYGYRHVCCFYRGDNLTKAGTINKKEPKRTGYQSNDITKPKTT